jgi:hypothetical protein
LRYTQPPQTPRGEPTAGVDPSDPRAAESTLARVPGDFGGGGDPTGGEAGGPRLPTEGPEVIPGSYTVTLNAAGQERQARLIVEGDPRVTISDEDRRARFEVLWRIYEMQQQVIPLQQRFGSVTRQMREITRLLGEQKDAPEDLKKAADETARAVRDLNTRIGRALQQASGVGRDVQSSTSAPTAAQREPFMRGSEALPALLKQAEELFAKKLPVFAADLEKRAPAKVPRLRLTEGTSQ